MNTLDSRRDSEGFKDMRNTFNTSQASRANNSLQAIKGKTAVMYPK